eukprot:4591837-Pyramimonas_sp.AAC.1
MNRRSISSISIRRLPVIAMSIHSVTIPNIILSNNKRSTVRCIRLLSIRRALLLEVVAVAVAAVAVAVAVAAVAVAVA